MNVSFVIPCYNEESVIATCVKSIHKEAYSYSLSVPNFSYEIIVVDNNSTDKTIEIATQEGANIVLCSQQGLLYARQAGYSNARHNLIANIDADMIIPLGWLDNLEYLEDNDVVCISGPYRYMNQSKLFYLAEKFFYFLFYFTLPSVQGGNCVIKKKALDAVGGYDTNITFYGEDTSTAKRLFRIGKVKLIHRMWAWSSPRRLEKQGLINTIMTYVLNYFSIWFLNRPLHKEYKNYR